MTCIKCDGHCFRSLMLFNRSPHTQQLVTIQLYYVTVSMYFCWSSAQCPLRLCQGINWLHPHFGDLIRQSSTYRLPQALAEFISCCCMTEIPLSYWLATETVYKPTCPCLLQQEAWLKSLRPPLSLKRLAPNNSCWASNL